MLVELSVVEQRYHAVMEVLTAGATKTDVAARYGVSRQSVHEWICRYEAAELAGLADRSHRPHRHPAQMLPEVEADLRRLNSEEARPGLAPGGRWPAGTMFAALYGELAPHPWRDPDTAQDDRPPGPVQRRGHLRRHRRRDSGGGAAVVFGCRGGVPVPREVACHGVA